jgi:hypothetical protein
MNQEGKQMSAKSIALQNVGGLTKTSKMGCNSYSLPTAECKTGAAMAKIAGSICAQCYAKKGFYKVYAKTILPAQYRRLESIDSPDWVANMVTSIGNDRYFRWHDSGDIQSVAHLEKIAAVCDATPRTLHWLPTREYAMVKTFVSRRPVPANLTIRLSAMFPDKAVEVPASLENVPGVAVSNVHAKAAPNGIACPAPTQGNKCLDCRACWNRNVTTVSYKAH